MRRAGLKGSPGKGPAGRPPVLMILNKSWGPGPLPPQAARLHLLSKTRTLQDGEPEVDCVPEEDAGERVREDRGNPEGLQGHGRLLPARSAPAGVPPPEG